jgi:glycosyltransferase involved in cell wall biosynthesis
MDNLTALTVVYNTADLLIASVGSFQRFYPNIPLLIMNNSDPDHECTDVAKEYEHKYQNISLFNYEENQGHGHAVNDGICMINTDYIYYFDSDVNMKVEGLLEAMMAVVDKTTYAVGKIIYTDICGRNIRNEFEGERVKYLFPAACLINRSVYHEYHPWTRYGLPPFKAYLEIHKKDDEILKEFPIFSYATHLSGGTRARYGDCEDIVKPLKGEL